MEWQLLREKGDERDRVREGEIWEYGLGRLGIRERERDLGLNRKRKEKRKRKKRKENGKLNQKELEFKLKNKIRS